MSELDKQLVRMALPEWVPQPVHHYLAHTVQGQSIRSLARASDVHPSTVMRQVRRYEVLRDDPLVDDALRDLAMSSGATEADKETRNTESMPHMRHALKEQSEQELTQEGFEKAALPILRRLCEPGALLAVARDMETAVIMREDTGGEVFRTAVVDRNVAQALAIKGWISTADPSLRIVRYFVSNAGRTALRGLTAKSENKAQGFRENATTRRGVSNVWDMAEEAGRYQSHESPLVGLARRRTKDGSLFLQPDLVQAGERLREDYELCFLDKGAAEDWQTALGAPAKANTAQATLDARARVLAALTDLGPGLADIALRCCCFLEGLEITEKKMGWSARSGKIVLRIALQRLSRHYDEQGKYRPMIG